MSRKYLVLSSENLITSLLHYFITTL